VKSENLNCLYNNTNPLLKDTGVLKNIQNKSTSFKAGHLYLIHFTCQEQDLVFRVFELRQSKAKCGTDLLLDILRLLVIVCYWSYMKLNIFTKLQIRVHSTPD